MHLSADISSALQQIEAVKKGIEDSNDPKLQMNTEESLKTILDILQDPVFRNIVHVQDSLSELNSQLAQHPSMLPNDFDIDVAGNLVLSVHGDVMYDFDERMSSSQASIHSPGSPMNGHVAATTPGIFGATIPGSAEQSLAEDVNSGAYVKKTRQLAAEIEEVPRPQSQNSKPSSADLLSADYAQIQAIELVNDGTGLGFGIIGARSSGVIVKTILSGGVADRDGRLRSGDHILQIGDVNLHDMVSEQVASVLRQSGTHVRLVVARPMECALPKYELDPGCAIVPSRVLVDPVELERYLISTGYPEIFGESSTASTPQTTTDDDRFVYRGVDTSLLDISKRPPIPAPLDLDDLLELPETETLQVELTKDANGLGITIAGYVCEKEELSGIFVKSVSPGSAADMSGRIRVNDRIIEVDGQSLQGFSNHQAVELLKKSGQVVNLRLERYLRGPKYEQLQQAIAANDKIPSSVPSTPLRAAQYTAAAAGPVTPQRTSSIPTMAKVAPTSAALDEVASHDQSIDKSPLLPKVPPPTLMAEHMDDIISPAATTTLNSFGSGKRMISVRDFIDGTPKIIPTDVPLPVMAESVVGTVDNEEQPLNTLNSTLIARHKYFVDPVLMPEVEQEIIRKWRKIVGPDVDVIVAQIKKFSVGGLGISLEGTVDVEGGREVRPHHYIRSILADGPVGVNGVLRSGDELLEVNGERLLGMNHLAVVAILKDLPQDVRMVCGRGKSQTVMSFSDDTLKKLSSNFENLLPTSDRLVKAKSDGSLATVSSGNDDSFSKLKSRSLEPLTGLAMWSSEPQIIELVKGDRGLGFSILDYQDPLDPNDTLIVIRSLVPGGVAQLDGRLIPGDRLLFVNSINLENASLDQAVQALKGAPKGVVRIGVAKPLPMTDNSIKSSTSAIGSSELADDASLEGSAGAASDFGSAKQRGMMAEPDLIPGWRQ